MPRLPPRLAPLAVSLVALALGACADPAPEPVPAGPGGAPSALALGPEGVGPLGAETPFDTAAVRAALPPGFAVELQSADADGERAPVIWALRDGLLVLEVYPGADGRVGRVDAASDQVEGPDGARTGQGFAEVGGGRMDCEPGEEDLTGRVVCRARRGPVRYVFAHSAPAGTPPDDDQLADALLERLVWRAD